MVNSIRQSDPFRSPYDAKVRPNRKNGTAMRVKRPKLRVKRLFGGLNGREPRLEFGDAGLGNDDALRSFEHETQRKTAAEPHGDLLHGAARHDELAVGAEEIGFGQDGLQRFERLVERIGRPGEGIGRHLLVAGIAECDILAFERNDLVADMHQKGLLAARRGQRAHARTVIAALARCTSAALSGLSR